MFTDVFALTRAFIQAKYNRNSVFAQYGLSMYLIHLSLVLRKPVFGVSDQVPHKVGWTATEDG